MVIVDKDLIKFIERKNIIIESIDPEFPFNPELQVGPGSIDLRLSNKFRKYKKNVSFVDLSISGDTESFDLDANQDLIIEPGELLLATTLEIVILPANISGIITGRSSISRLGLLVQCTQDFIQPGHSHLIPLQLVNVINRPIHIKPYLLICQIILLYTTSSAITPYNERQHAKYLNELISPEPSRIGIELGLDKPEDLELPAETTNNFIDLKKEVNNWKNKVKSAEATRDSIASRIRRVINAVFVILGASVGLIIFELNVTPFPSTKFLVASSFALLCIYFVIIANWRQK